MYVDVFFVYRSVALQLLNVRTHLSLTRLSTVLVAVLDLKPKDRGQFRGAALVPELAEPSADLSPSAVERLSAPVDQVPGEGLPLRLKRSRDGRVGRRPCGVLGRVVQPGQARAQREDRRVGVGGSGLARFDGRADIRHRDGARQ